MSTTLKVDCPYCREPMQLILLKMEDVRGGQKPHEGERFSSFKSDEPGAVGGQYYPVKLLAKFLLSELPTKAKFLAACKEPDEDEDEEVTVNLETGRVTTVATEAAE